MSSAQAAARAGSAARIGFLGPAGTFSEQALLSQKDLAAMELVDYSTIPDVLAATESGEVDLGFVPIENSIEGTVNAALDVLALESDLLIQREVVINVQLNLLALPGVAIDELTSVAGFPVAMAQVRTWLREHLAGAEVVAANSNADAARLVQVRAERSIGAVSTALAAELYGLDVVASDIEDHPENQTRFVVVARTGIPAPTGHDKSTIVCFQRSDQPGSLLAILQEFAARAVNLTKLESRPTKKGLGHYCFIIDLDGHIDDELVADALRDLKSKLADVKFLGSYPAAGDEGHEVRRDASASWKRADEWIARLRSGITGR
ncbi:MAG: prephenate dehydratase [Actinomycetota bacterium]|jgi:prephenate dehydratase|nr:prephenate dehydratase [Actinomycetota bacterium]